MKETFFHKESERLLGMLDDAARRSGQSRSRAFEDFLEVVVCKLSGGRMEEQYLKVVQRYAAGEQGQRGIDRLAELFGKLVRVMEETRADILGDLYQGAITRGENGQYLTPETVARCMAQIVGHDEKGDEAERQRKTVCDPCCGSGRMLLAAADIDRARLFVGQDVDLRCVRMTAINLALRNLYGYVVWGNSLSMEQWLAYETGFDGVGVIKEVPPVPTAAPRSAPAVQHGAAPPTAEKPRKGGQERTLFDELE